MFDRLQNVLKEETESYSSAKALMEAPVVGMHTSCVYGIAYLWAVITIILEN